MNSVEFFAGLIVGGVLGFALAFIICTVVVAYAKIYHNGDFNEEEIKD